MKKQFVLTVSESKRLIAKGVASLPQVQRAMKEGIVAVAPGTTNAYILRELWGKEFELARYRSGVTTPTGSGYVKLHPDLIPDVVFVKGKVDEGLDRATCIEKMGHGDIYIKGANAVDYFGDVAGVLIGHPVGGTVGGSLPGIIGKKIELIIPVGLEKRVEEDIHDLHHLASTGEFEGPVPNLWPVSGTIVTEIEALRVLTGVDAYLYAAGGVDGAEGSVRLLVEGTEDEVKEATELVDSVKGEPPYPL
jgi:hypothetical protein